MRYLLTDARREVLLPAAELSTDDVHRHTESTMTYMHLLLRLLRGERHPHRAVQDLRQC
jgi:hypothetical protein